MLAWTSNTLLQGDTTWGKNVCGELWFLAQLLGAVGRMGVVLWRSRKNRMWQHCIIFVQMPSSRCGGVSTLCGGGQCLGKGLPQAPPSHHPFWHWDWLGGRGWSYEGEIFVWSYFLPLRTVNIFSNNNNQQDVILVITVISLISCVCLCHHPSGGSVLQLKEHGTGSGSPPRGLWCDGGAWCDSKGSQCIPARHRPLVSCWSVRMFTGIHTDALSQHFWHECSVHII